MSVAGGALKGAPPERVRPAQHVHYAIVEETAILLDLKADRYVAVSAAAFRELLNADDVEKRSFSAQALAQKLHAQGLLSESAAMSDVRAFGALHVWCACVWADIQVRRRRLDLTLSGLRRDFTRCTRAPSIAALDCFRAWRPWYPRRAVCLFDSLALARFLIASGECAEIVFGVRHPHFAAHCWLESEGRVLNDEPTNCAAFVPILRM